VVSTSECAGSGFIVGKDATHLRGRALSFLPACRATTELSLANPKMAVRWFGIGLVRLLG
jgi:hypothetical protein